MFRQALSLILIACLFTAPLAKASAAAAPALVHPTDPASMKEAVKSAVLAKPTEFAVGIGHGLLFVMTIAGIDLLVHEIRKEGLNTQTIAPAKLFELASKVAVEVVNNGQILTSLVSATVFASASQRPAEALTKMLVDPASKKMLASMIASSIVSTVGFLAWEFGAQLWTDASLMLESKDDYKRLSTLTGVGAGSFRTLLHLNPSATDANDLRIAQQMLSNILTILFFDRNLLGQWFENSWRLRVLTGESITFLTLTFAGSTLGSILLPGGGTFIGFMFGFAAASLVPRWMNNSITFSLKTARAQISLGRLMTNETQLRSLFREGSRMSSFQRILTDRRAIRESVVTGAAEQLHLSLRILQSDQYGKSARRKAHVRIDEAIARIQSLYTDETTTLEKLRDLSQEPSLLSEIERIKTLREFWEPALSELSARVAKDEQPLTAQMAAEPDTEKLLKFVESLHLRGYLEQTVL
jgi:hypothetical protein